MQHCQLMSIDLTTLLVQPLQALNTINNFVQTKEKAILYIQDIDEIMLKVSKEIIMSLYQYLKQLSTRPYKYHCYLVFSSKMSFLSWKPQQEIMDDEYINCMYHLLLTWCHKIDLHQVNVQVENLHQLQRQE